MAKFFEVLAGLFALALVVALIVDFVHLRAPQQECRAASASSSNVSPAVQGSNSPE